MPFVLVQWLCSRISGSEEEEQEVTGNLEDRSSLRKCGEEEKAGWQQLREGGDRDCRHSDFTLPC
jgi:hypothetical protein